MCPFTQVVAFPLRCLIILTSKSFYYSINIFRNELLKHVNEWCTNLNTVRRNPSTRVRVMADAAGGSWSSIHRVLKR
ncbi:hypothetical protein TNCV_4555181 [Trichonephila clavipes]|nr:hypothetical protein TNCV_4555181 [Trichonephila clavipes]